jgi:hypothetical protein
VTELNKADLDRHITGNYGEDQFRRYGPECRECEGEGCAECEGRGYYDEDEDPDPDRKHDEARDEGDKDSRYY